MIPSPKLCEEQLLIWYIYCRIGSTIAEKIAQLGGTADTVMPIFSLDTLDFLVIDIFLEER